MSAISIKGLSVSYDRKTVLTNIYMDMQAGQLYGVLGPNGAGKSTLFKAILGLIPVNTGQVLINGQAIESQRKKMVYIPQKGEVDWQFPATVMDVVMMGRYPFKRILQRLSGQDKDIAMQALRDMGIDQLRDRQIGELSGGQQQRVFIARALCQQADIFLMDEPFVGVDIKTEQKIVEILKQLRSAGKTILVIHHDLSKVQDYFDQVILLNQWVVAYGDTATVFTEENINRAYRGQLNILHKTGLH